MSIVSPQRGCSAADRVDGNDMPVLASRHELVNLPTQSLAVVNTPCRQMKRLGSLDGLSRLVPHNDFLAPRISIGPVLHQGDPGVLQLCHSAARIACFIKWGIPSICLLPCLSTFHSRHGRRSPCDLEFWWSSRNQAKPRRHTAHRALLSSLTGLKQKDDPLSLRLLAVTARLKVMKPAR